jgi:hypothetical protein
MFLAALLRKRGYKPVTFQRKQKWVTNINMQPIDFVEEPMMGVELTTY